MSKVILLRQVNDNELESNVQKVEVVFWGGSEEIFPLDQWKTRNAERSHSQVIIGINVYEMYIGSDYKCIFFRMWRTCW